MAATSWENLAAVDALRRTWPHQRLCLIYREKSEQCAAASQFLKLGLRKKDPCLLLAAPADAAAILAAVGGAAPRPDGALHMISERRAFRRAGRFQTELFFERLAQWRREAAKNPHEELRLACDMAWLLGAHSSEQRILEFEARMSQFARAENVLGLFAWDRGVFSPAAVRSALNTYPLLAYDGSVARNFNYLSPEELLGPNRGVGELDRLLSEVVEREKIERQIREERESLMALVDAIPETACLLAPTGKVIQCNEEAARRFGTTQEELLGSCLYDFFPTEMAHRRQRIQAAVRTGQRQRFVDQRSGRTYDNIVCPVFDVLGYVTRLAILGVDVTDRLRAEDALRRTVQRLESFRSMVNQSPAIVILARICADWPIEFISDNVAQLGYLAEDVIAGRVRWLDIAHPDDGSRMFAQIEENLRLGLRPRPAQFRLRDAAGEYHWMEGHVRLLADDEGNWTRVQAVMIDITKSKQMELALNAQQDRLQSIFRAAPVGIGVVANRILKEVNDRVCELSGYAREELVGQSAVLLYVSPAEFERVGQEVTAQLRECAVAAVETRFRRKDGRVIDVQLNLAPLHPAAPTGDLTFTALDVTDRKAAAEALRQSEEKFRAVFDGAAVGIGIIGMDGAVLQANPALMKMSGYPPEALARHGYPGLRHPAEAAAFWNFFNEMAASPHGRGSRVEKFVRGDGVTIWARIDASLVAGAAGRPPYLVVAAHDVTELVSAQEENARLKEQRRETSND
jgi:PAS domain S-box-containing protein